MWKMAPVAQAISSLEVSFVQAFKLGIKFSSSLKAHNQRVDYSGSCNWGVCCCTGLERQGKKKKEKIR